MNMSSYQVDALTEIINIGVGKAASVLNDLLKTHVNLSVPYLKVCLPSELNGEITKLGKNKLSAVRIFFKGHFSGSASLLFPPSSASKLVKVLTGSEAENADLDSIKVETLSEVGNIVINGVMGSIANMLTLKLNYSLPAYLEGNLLNFIADNGPSASGMVILAQTRFTIQEYLIEGEMLLFFEVASFNALINAIDAYSI